MALRSWLVLAAIALAASACGNRDGDKASTEGDRPPAERASGDFRPPDRVRSEDLDQGRAASGSPRDIRPGTEDRLPPPPAPANADDVPPPPRGSAPVARRAAPPPRASDVEPPPRARTDDPPPARTAARAARLNVAGTVVSVGGRCKNVIRDARGKRYVLDRKAAAGLKTGQRVRFAATEGDEQVCPGMLRVVPAGRIARA